MSILSGRSPGSILLELAALVAVTKAAARSTTAYGTRVNKDPTSSGAQLQSCGGVVCCYWCVCVCVCLFVCLCLGVIDCLLAWRAGWLAGWLTVGRNVCVYTLCVCIYIYIYICVCVCFCVCADGCAAMYVDHYVSTPTFILSAFVATHIYVLHTCACVKSWVRSR